MTYAQKLKSPLWQKKRLQILERDKWRCQCCWSSLKNLQVHHLYYAKKDPWEYPDEVYQTLCEDCHWERQILVDKAVEQIRLAIAKCPTQFIKEVLASATLTVREQTAAHFQKVIRSEEESETPVSVENGRALFAAMRAASKNNGGPNG